MRPSPSLVAGALLATCGMFLSTPCGAQSAGLLHQDTRGGFLRFDRTDLQLLGAGTFLTLAAFSTESAARASSRLDNAAAIDVPMDAGNVYGSSWTLAGLTAGLGAFGYATGRSHLTSAAWDMGRSLLISGAIVGAIKVSVNRTRPNTGSYSFPSGHTAGAFAVAPVLDAHFGWKLGVPAYTIAAFTALGRMEDNKHYLSDVIAGATIGLLTGRMIVRRNSRLQLYGNAGGAGFTWDF